MTSPVRIASPVPAVRDWLVAHSTTVLRVSMGLVFLAFGFLKFFPGVSPAEPLVAETLGRLSLGLIGPAAAGPVTAVLECALGLLLVTGLRPGFTVALLMAELAGILSPLVLVPGRMFEAGAPTLEGQYVLKDVVLVAAGLVIAAHTWRHHEHRAPPSRR